MKQMSRRERVLAAVTRQPVDRVPYAVWRHFPSVDHSPAGLAQATLRFHERYGSDFLKITPRGGYAVEAGGCVEGDAVREDGHRPCAICAVRSGEDWKKIRVLDPAAAPGYAGEIETIIRLGFDRRIGDAPVVPTLFSPLSLAKKLSGDRLPRDLRDHPAVVAGALEAITETLIKFALLALAVGASARTRLELGRPRDAAVTGRRPPPGAGGGHRWAPPVEDAPRRHGRAGGRRSPGRDRSDRGHRARRRSGLRATDEHAGRDGRGRRPGARRVAQADPRRRPVEPASLSHVEPEVADLPVPDDVVLALEPQLPPRTEVGERAVDADQIVVAVDLRPDEPPTDVGVNGARSVLSPRALRDRPGTDLVLPHGKKRHEPKQGITVT